MITIKTRIERNSMEDKIYLGMLVEKATGGDFGDYLKCLFEGIQRAVLDESRRVPAISADRYLGRLEALQTIKDEFEVLVQVKNQLLEDKLDESKIRPAE